MQLLAGILPSIVIYLRAVSAPVCIRTLGYAESNIGYSWHHSPLHIMSSSGSSRVGESVTFIGPVGLVDPTLNYKNMGGLLA
jgi:hypothetical protein